MWLTIFPADSLCRYGSSDIVAFVPIMRTAVRSSRGQKVFETFRRLGPPQAGEVHKYLIKPLLIRRADVGAGNAISALAESAEADDKWDYVFARRQLQSA